MLTISELYPLERDALPGPVGTECVKGLGALTLVVHEMEILRTEGEHLQAIDLSGRALVLGPDRDAERRRRNGNGSEVESHGTPQELRRIGIRHGTLLTHEVRRFWVQRIVP